MLLLTMMIDAAAVRRGESGGKPEAF